MRRRVPTRVPVLPRRLVLKDGETPAEAFFRLLRETARSGRMAQDQTFYSLREIATRFRVPLSPVNRAFVRLENEGLLAKVRGSRTILPGRKFDRHLYIRGVIGMPVSIFRFSAFADYREFVLAFRRKLRRHQFMPAAVFYERDQNRADFLSERLSDAKADHVLWFSPRRAPREILPILRDAGVRVIGVADSSPTTIPCHYRIDREKALRVIVREWRGAGLTSTVVLAGEREASPAAKTLSFSQCGGIAALENRHSEGSRSEPGASANLAAARQWGSPHRGSCILSCPAKARESCGADKGTPRGPGRRTGWCLVRRDLRWRGRFDQSRLGNNRGPDHRGPDFAGRAGAGGLRGEEPASHSAGSLLS